MSRYDVIVIGAGHNGLTAATLLAKQGRNVAVIERRGEIGGLAASDEFYPGYRTAGVLHDTTQVRDWVIEALDLRRHGLETRREVPPVFVAEKNGRGYVHWQDAGKARQELSALSQKDVESYKRYRAFIKKVAPILRRVFDQAPVDTESPSVGELFGLGRTALALRLLGKDDMMEFFRIAPMCVADWVGEWFETEIVRAAVAGPAVTHGVTGPWSPGTNLNLLLAETFAGSGIQGGPRALAEALHKAATAAGAEIRTGVAVTRIGFQDRAVASVSLSNGEVLEAGQIAASCDPKHLFLDLVEPALLGLDFESNVTHFRTRGTAAKIDLALRGYPALEGRSDFHPLFVRTGATIDELEHAFDPIKYRDFSHEPMLEAYVPTLESAALAPPDHHVMSVLVHWVPYDLDGGWTDDSRQRLFDSVLDTLTAYMPEIRDLVVGSRVLTPADLEAEYGTTGGHLYHGEHATDQLLLRPTPETARYATPFRGLYLCGSGSHPGGGLTCAPGALAARSMLT